MWMTSLANNVRLGAGALLEGARFVRVRRKLWPLIVVPVLLNVLLFVGFVAGFLMLIQGFFVGSLPATWWGILIGVIVIVGALAAVVYVGALAFVFVGSIVGAPFYDTLAQRVAREEGMIVVDRSLWQEIWRPIKHAVMRLGLYGILQLAIFACSFVPGIGTTFSVIAGFVVTAFFLGFEFLDFSFEFSGWTFTERLRWCIQESGVLIAFGSTILVGMLVPLLNLFIPPIAVVAGILLFSHKKPTV